MYVFSIYDTISEDWSSPFCAKNIEHLKRVLGGVFNKGLVLDECYIECLAWLNPEGKAENDEKKISIFDNGHYYQYLSDLFDFELKQLKEKEVKENV